MKKLLSLPPNLVSHFHALENVSPEEWFCTSDPVDSHLGSGGGTVWLLRACWEKEAPEIPFEQWLAQEKRILLHAGGQSRRLPAYAPSGKILTPVPVFRWERGQRLSQNLLSLVMPLYEDIIKKAPDSLRTLVASGDVYIRNDQPLESIPEADVVCYGIWTDNERLTKHGVFLFDREVPDKLHSMVQKPSLEELREFSKSYLYMMDIGIWLLSDRAVELLLKRTKGQGDAISFYDLYGQFGLALGETPKVEDKELGELTVAVQLLEEGEFYHFGTTGDLVESTTILQNAIMDQRLIKQRKVKSHPSIFVQNAVVGKNPEEAKIWIENSCVGEKWSLEGMNVITGVPPNDWPLVVAKGKCVDVVAVGDSAYVARPYGYWDSFPSKIDSQTTFITQDLFRWCDNRGIPRPDEGSDLQNWKIFPVCRSEKELYCVIQWMIGRSTRGVNEMAKKIWTNAVKLSANELLDKANLSRLVKQREEYRKQNWPVLAKNHEHSVFYQLDLANAAEEYLEMDIPLPEPLPDSAPATKRMADHMFRSRVLKLSKKDYRYEQQKAFQALREGMLHSQVLEKQMPKCNVFQDQIIWGRSPARIDLAGGWTDTPPYCLSEGGSVINMAIELNGQLPLQVYVKPSKEYTIQLRSIDMGAMEVVSTWEELNDYTRVGSPFSIPKAALAMIGFSPEFASASFSSLEEQLKSFGCGIEVALLVTIPSGSGLGTSSILAATVLGTLSEFCGMGWDKNEIGNRTLLLEQLLTTGGGWQDQYGGLLHGLKLLETSEGLLQKPHVRWLPEYLFTDPEYQPCHLLYYTGITRTAKVILAEIVQGMFLNSQKHLSVLKEMKIHTQDLYQAIQECDYEQYGRLIRKSWELNKALDTGTNPPAVEALIDLIQDYCLGYKLPGAGGGGYLYMVAKDLEAAQRIKQILTVNATHANARFVDMNLSTKGLQISRS